MRRWLIYQAVSSTDSSQWWMQPHGLYSRHGSPSTSHHCSVTFTGCGCPSGLSLNSLCSPSIAYTVWLRHTLHASCTVWQTSTHDDDWAPRPHLRSTCHRRIMLWCYYRRSATVPSALPLRSFGTLCRPTSPHCHHPVFIKRHLKTFLYTNFHAWHCHYCNFCKVL